MVNIFLSWSGDRSKAVAEYLSSWMPRVIHNCKPWISVLDIEKGQRWAVEVGSKLEQNQFGIICVTPENYKASWLLFEAGALSKFLDEARVCPLLFGMSPSELSGPLSQFQATTIAKDDVLKLLQSINSQLGELRLASDILNDSFDKYWPDLESRMLEISKIQIPGSQVKLNRVISAFSKYGLPEPSIGSEASFSGGFESHGLYSSVMEIANHRLWIFGRKNRKLFDKEHKDFYDKLSEKTKNGLDFRVLFLDPNAPFHVINSAHQDEDFSDQLSECIDRANKVITKASIANKQCCRKYAINRTTSMVIVDDAVVYSPIRLDSHGKAQKLTKAPFTIINSGSDFGKELVSIFEEQWDSSSEI